MRSHGSAGKGKGVRKFDSQSNGRRSSPKGLYIMDRTLVPRLRQVRSSSFYLIILLIQI